MRVITEKKVQGLVKDLSARSSLDTHRGADDFEVRLRDPVHTSFPKGIKSTGLVFSV